MKTYPASITAPHNRIMASNVFRLDGPPIDLPAALIELADAVHAEKDLPEFIWDKLGEHTEAPLGSLLVGAYWALTEWHAGQSSDSYAALCAVGQVFSPGCTNAPDEESSEFTAYEMVGRWFEETSPARD